MEIFVVKVLVDDRLRQIVQHSLDGVECAKSSPSDDARLRIGYRGECLSQSGAGRSGRLDRHVCRTRRSATGRRPL